MSWMENEKRIEDAILSFSLGEEKEAERLLLESLDQDSFSVDALRALAEVYLAQGKLEEAESTCRRAIAIDAHDLSLFVSLARILVRKGDKEGAEEATGKARLLGWKEELAEGDPTD